LTRPICIANSAPAIPAKNADTEKTSTRVTLTPRPSVVSAVGESAMARRNRPSRDRRTRTSATQQTATTARTM
jgi:hypothetical protein